jgi:hypothetical protein
VVVHDGAISVSIFLVQPQGVLEFVDRGLVHSLSVISPAERICGIRGIGHSSARGLRKFNRDIDVATVLQQQVRQWSSLLNYVPVALAEGGFSQEEKISVNNSRTMANAYESQSMLLLAFASGVIAAMKSDIRIPESSN